MIELLSEYSHSYVKGKKKHIFGRQNLFVLHLCSNTGHLRRFNTKAAPYKIILIILAGILYYQPKCYSNVNIIYTYKQHACPK